METRIEGDEIRSQGRSSPSYAEALREIGSSTKDVLQSELALIKAELEVKAKDAGKHLTQAVIFGSLLAISVLPFLAFLVIGLGNLMGGMYWLSSLIVAVVCAVVGGIFAYRAYKQIKDHDLNFEHTRRSLRRESHVAQEKIEDVKLAAKGERNEYDRLH